jgi:hypothetical protein
MVALSFSPARAPPDKLVPIDGTALSNRFVDPSSVVFINSYIRAKDLVPSCRKQGNEAF